MRESKRNNAVYRREALASLGDFVDLREDQDMYPLVLEIIEPVMQNWLDDPDHMDVDSPSGGPSSKSMLVTKLGRGFAASANMSLG